MTYKTQPEALRLAEELTAGEHKTLLYAVKDNIEKLQQQIEKDEELLRQALKALELFAWDTLSGRNAAYAIRERLGLEEEQA